MILYILNVKIICASWFLNIKNNEKKLLMYVNTADNFKVVLLNTDGTNRDDRINRPDKLKKWVKEFIDSHHSGLTANCFVGLT